MELNKIMTADVIDIIFEGRNKDYGAYELRKTYNKRLVIALLGTGMLSAIFFIGYLVASNIPDKKKSVMIINDVTLDKVSSEKIQQVVLPPRPQERPKVATIKSTTPIIVRDQAVSEDDMPPKVEELEDTRIGNINQQGIKEDIVAPPLSDGHKGIIETPRKKEDGLDTTFVRVEIESSYPGGAGAWSRYLNKTLRFPPEAQEGDIQGTIIVQFIVDKEGNVSDVEAISGPTSGGLRDEAVRVIRKSGKWEPAIQNGRKVKSYKKQPVTFRLAE